MKALRIALGVLVVAGALFGIGRLFVGQLAGAGRPAGATAGGPVGVLLAPPPGFVVEPGGELRREAAAASLAALLARRQDEPRLGLHFTASGAELYWLVERDARSTVLTELAAAPSGTRVATTWRGSGDELDRRLAWAAAHGTLAAPALPGGEARNLYH